MGTVGDSFASRVFQDIQMCISPSQYVINQFKNPGGSAPAPGEKAMLMMKRSTIHAAEEPNMNIQI